MLLWVANIVSLLVAVVSGVIATEYTSVLYITAPALVTWLVTVILLVVWRESFFPKP